MRIGGLQKLTLLDFPGKDACTVFTPGCNYRCPFCQNIDLVIPGTSGIPGAIWPSIDEEEVFKLLAKRHGLLDGVAITGGEPCLQPDLEDFCKRVKDEGFLVKLDTNGTFPATLGKLIEDGLVDYVAMDVKNCPSRYAETVGVPKLELAPIYESIDLLMGSGIDYEFRTTVVRELHSPLDLQELAEWLAPAKAWALQKFIDGDYILAGSGRFSAYSDEEMLALTERLRSTCPTVTVRGVSEY